jgi:hypothetical protein
VESSEEVRWAARWAVAGVELAAVKRRELRALTDDDAARAIADLLDLAAQLPAREGGSGLVEQQRLLAPLRRR